jgi:hypothetical protein
VRFKNSFTGNIEAFTVKDMEWNGIKNGQLLLLLKENKFDAWIVVDKSIPYQQNLLNLPCLIIVLNVYRNTLQYLLPLIPQILEVLQSHNTSKIVIIEP